MLTEREAWLLELMAHATAFTIAQLFKPFTDVETVERTAKTIMAMVELHGGVYEQAGNTAKQTIGRGEGIGNEPE